MISRHQLAALYTPLIFWTGIGWCLGRLLPQSAATYLGYFLFWAGVPFCILVFIRNASLTEPVWIAAGIAWIAVLLGGLLAYGFCRQQHWSRATQGSFYLASMFGNTGYLGYPIILTLLGSQALGWALFYDLAGTTVGAYGLGVAIAGFFGRAQPTRRQVLGTLVKNPALWSLPIGIGFRSVTVPIGIDHGLTQIAWVIVNLALLLIGMRLSRLVPQQRITPVLAGLGIKMLAVPLIVHWILSQLGMTGDALRVLVLQMAMPPAFATLVLTETFDLDHDLTISLLVSGSIGLLALIPFWLWILG